MDTRLFCRNTEINEDLFSSNGFHREAERLRLPSQTRAPWLDSRILRAAEETKPKYGQFSCQTAVDAVYFVLMKRTTAVEVMFVQVNLNGFGNKEEAEFTATLLHESKKRDAGQESAEKTSARVKLCF